MSIVFCNIGWMKNYDGIQGDAIQRGGSYNKDSVGHEVCNFTHCRGKIYGYVQPTGRISVERLGAPKGAEQADGVTVVWTAGPDTGGTAIVGWYTNAKVFRDLQDIPSPCKKHRDNKISEYRIVASADNAHLIPAEERDFLIPRRVKGGIGQSNVWYADKPESAALVADVIKYIQSGTRTSRLPDVDTETTASEGNPRLVAHLRRERSPSLVEKKKKSVLAANGKLCCEACEFDFEATYGKSGYGFCEVHHLKPISQMDKGEVTTLADLAVVCSNCHRIIHRIDPMPSIEQFRRIITPKS
ncbi:MULTISPECIES: HNH endonuclease [unclassified Halomonas]|uniref:HNH endonuclease n=1 Tax=unclassified Halomonas TaxID=2609666 RepID=UPI0007D9B7CA|nr:MULTISPECIES: HNH endonuclease [unclassified Halomonas]MBT2785492.1 HNH endonuclease [Halomonas sp. ISL-106]MBT2797824.1 HNH endonuclease [Halomonas sp. ISL-104]OAL59338.1 HNH endonuclease [Halomonas sp. ALS9]